MMRGPIVLTRKRKLLALGLSLPLALVACTSSSKGTSSSSSGSGGAGKYGFKIAGVTHGAVGDTFWGVVKKGALQAGKDEGDNVTYQSDGDPQKQSQLIDAAVNEKVDGLVVSMANPDALQDSIKAAVKAGIPVVTINSGGDRSAEFGAIGHVGQDETIAGQGAGQRLKSDGA